MIIFFKLGSMITLLVLSCFVGAATKPTSNYSDPHIKSFVYQPNQLYQIKGMHGYTSAVQFSRGEEILSANLGDSAAWQVNVNSEGHLVFLKPLTLEADTNLTILTSRGLYQFVLTVEPMSYDERGRMHYKSPPDDVVFLAHFRYPNSQNGTILSNYRSRFSYINMNYSARGDREIVPQSLFDDGEKTYLQFSRNQAIPAIFAVDDHGKESMLNYHLDGQYVVVEQIGKHFNLRHGAQLAALFNEVKHG